MTIGIDSALKKRSSMLEGKFAERNSYICLILSVCQDLHLTETAIHGKVANCLTAH